jgi:acyl carrier protein
MRRTPEAVVAELKRILAEDMDLNLKVEEIDATAPLLVEGLNLDSIVIVELIAVVEVRVGFEFADEDLRTAWLASVEALAGVLEKRTVP